MTHYLITTDHNSATRHDYIREHLERHGIGYTSVLAVDYRLFPLPVHKARHLSLTLAYFQIAQTARFENISRYIVLEDDVNLTAGWELLEDMLLTLPTDTDLAYLTRTRHNKASAVTEYENFYFDRVISNWWETPVTLWTASGRDKFLSYVESKIAAGDFIGNIDHVLNQIPLVRYGATHNTANGLSTARDLAPQNMSFEGSISEH